MADKMTLEKFEEVMSTLPEDTDRRKLAKALGVELPEPKQEPSGDEDEAESEDEDEGEDKDEKDDE